MNSIRKIISIIICLSIVMSSFAAFSREYLTDYEYMDDVFKYDLRTSKSGNDDELDLNDPDVSRINFLTKIGVWDDASKPKTEFVTMTEFYIIMSNLKLGADNPFKGVYERETNVSKERVSYKQAYEAILEALGYYYKCAEYGGTDEAILVVASEIGLIEENPQNINSYITRKDLAKLVEKALKIDICVMETLDGGGYKYVVSSGTILLEKVHNVYDVSGFVNAVPGLSAYGGTATKEGFIQIDRRKMNTAGQDLSKYLGARVSAYATYDEGSKEYSIIFIDYEIGHSSLSVDFTDITKISRGWLYYIDTEDLEQEVDISNITYVTQNGVRLNSVEEMCGYAENEGKIVFSASEKYGDFDTAVIYKYNYFVSSYADTRQVRIGLQFNQQYNGEEYVQIDDKAVNDITVDGVKTDYSKIPAGSTFRYLNCEETGYTEIVAYTSKTEGEVLSIDQEFVNISEKDYRMSKDLLNIIEKGKTDTSIPYSERVKELDIGLNTIFYIFDNLVVGYVNTNTYKWGYLKAASKSRTSIDPEITLRILNEDSEWLNLKVKDKIELDGQKNVTKEVLMERIDENYDIVGNLVRYKVGKPDEIIALDTVVQTSYEVESTEDVEFVYNYNNYIGWTYKWLSFDCPYILSENTCIFVIPAGETDESKFKVVNNTALPSSSENNIPMKFYTPNDVHQVGAAICTKSLSDSSGGGGYVDGLVYIENIRQVILDVDNQEIGYKITGKTLVRSETGILGSLNERVFTVSEDVLDKNSVPYGDPAYDPNKVLEVGDLISPAIAGSTATTWSMILKEGRVPELASNTPDTSDSNFSTSINGQYRGWGTVKKVDPVQQYILVDYEDRIQPLFAQCKVIIDPVDHKIELVTIADIREGDIIWTSASNGRGVTIKNGDL